MENTDTQAETVPEAPQMARCETSTEPHITIVREGSSRDRWCVNYNGIAKGTCKAGVNYAAVETVASHTYSYDREKHRYHQDHAHPCFQYEHGLTNGCQHCRFPTPEENKARAEKMQRHISEMGTARAAIIAHINDARGVSGVMDCPVCKTGRLGYSRAQYNGHVHARCSTDGCVAWME